MNVLKTLPSTRGKKGELIEIQCSRPDLAVSNRTRREVRGSGFQEKRCDRRRPASIGGAANYRQKELPILQET
jgi:hypothetical protein